MRSVLRSLLLSCLVLAALRMTCKADQVDVQRALQSLPANSWYDKKEREYIPPRVSQEVDNPLRTHGWKASEKLPTPSQQTGGNSSWRWGNWGLANFMVQVMPWVVFVLMAVVLVVILALLTYYAFRNYMPVYSKRKTVDKAINVDMTRVVDLPFEVTSSQHNPLAEAERLMQLGQFNQALVYLYGYQLLALDQARRIHLQKGKTNRMYLRELRSYPRLRNCLEGTVQAFEDYYFGRHPVQREQFLKVWKQVDEFHQLLSAAEGHVPSPIHSPVVPA